MREITEVPLKFSSREACVIAFHCCSHYNDTSFFDFSYILMSALCPTLILDLRERGTESRVPITSLVGTERRK